MNTDDNVDVSIIGKWKLLKITIPFTPTGPASYDYSRNMIVYEFDTHGILTISVETDQVDRYKGHEAGEYPYLINDQQGQGQGQVGTSYGLEIGIFSTYWYRLSSKELIIDASPVDGYIYYFLKINQ